MGINTRWIHFVVLLLLLLRGSSGLLGQSADPGDVSSLSIEPWSRKKDEARKAEKQKTGKMPRSLPHIFAQCFTVDPDTQIRTYQSSCEVHFFNGYVTYSGGHSHNEGGFSRTFGQNIPRSRENPPTPADSISLITSPKPLRAVYSSVLRRWGQAGEYTASDKDGFEYNLNPSQVGQREWVMACNGSPVAFAANCGKYYFDVKYSGLSNYRPTITSSPLMTDIGWNHTKHKNNHYGTSGLKTALTRIVSDYYNEFGCYEKPADGRHQGWQAVGINDMSLEYGGVFDVNNNWKGPHWSHHKGNAVDIRCKPDERNSVIYVKDQPVDEQGIIMRFLEICDKHGLTESEFEYDRDGVTGEISNHHCHCATSASGEKPWKDPTN